MSFVPRGIHVPRCDSDYGTVTVHCTSNNFTGDAKPTVLDDFIVRFSSAGVNRLNCPMCSPHTLRQHTSQTVSTTVFLLLRRASGNVFRDVQPDHVILLISKLTLAPNSMPQSRSSIEALPLSGWPLSDTSWSCTAKPPLS